MIEKYYNITFTIKFEDSDCFLKFPNDISYEHVLKIEKGLELSNIIFSNTNNQKYNFNYDCIKNNLRNFWLNSQNNLKDNYIKLSKEFYK
jgi:hypothetical protein